MLFRQDVDSRLRESEALDDGDTMEKKYLQRLILLRMPVQLARQRVPSASRMTDFARWFGDATSEIKVVTVIGEPITGDRTSVGRCVAEGL